MTGDFTSVPLRAGDRWTAARMQQGRVLLDTDWNLNLDGPARDVRQFALDAIGGSGVPEGSKAFAVTLSGGIVSIGAGTMWVGGLLARNPAPLAYDAQDGIEALPQDGTVQFYLDAFEEEVQAAEDAGLLDPALDRVDTTTRTRVGWRLRWRPSDTATCSADGLPAPLSTGLLDVTRTSGPVSADPCAPPDDPRAKLPDGLLRIEVIDAGTASTARFAWSYSDGGDAVGAGFAGTAVSLAPSPAVTFAPGDLVETSTLARRADRRDHGPLLAVSQVTPQAGGDLVTLASPSTVAGTPPGACLRRWDGQVVGAAAAVAATLAGQDVGIAFTAGAGDYEVGDWWGVRVRGSAADAVEERTAAPADGTRHSFAPLAVVDLAKSAVLTDCRKHFPPLTEIRGGTCTVTAFPGDDLQAALDTVPATGGELCLAAGTYVVPTTLTVAGKQRLVITGVGPSTVLRVAGREAVLVATRCDDIEVTNVRVEGGSPSGAAPGDEHLLGALSFLGCDGVRVLDCELSCPDSNGRAQSGIYVCQAFDGDGRLPNRVEIRRNRLQIGDQQTGVLVADAWVSTITDNRIELAPAAAVFRPTRVLAQQLGRYVAGHLGPDQAGGGDVVDVPGAGRLRVGGSTQFRRLATEFTAATTEKTVIAAGGARAALERFARTAVLSPNRDQLSRASLGFLADAATTARSIGQGIVVAGLQAGWVTIEGNHIVSAIQGIHVGAGFGKTVATIGRLTIRGNRVENLVPFFWVRQRHAIYVGSCDSTTLVDNVAELGRGGFARIGEVRPTAVEAVRIWGRIGPYLQVRGLDVAGYAVGLRISDTTFAKEPQGVRYVSDVLNRASSTGAGVAVAIPPTFTHERCVP